MDDIFGTVENPLQAVAGGGGNYGELEEGGLILFLSNILKTVTIVAGLWVFVNLIIAGFAYITANQDQNKVQAAWQRIYMSMIGLMIIVAAYTLTAVVSLLLYGDLMTIFNPTLYRPGDL